MTKPLLLSMLLGLIHRIPGPTTTITIKSIILLL